MLALWMTLLRACLHLKKKKTMIENGCSVKAGLHSCLNHSQGYLNQGWDNRPIPSYILTIFFNFLCFSFSHIMSWHRGGFQISSQISHNTLSLLLLESRS